MAHNVQLRRYRGTPVVSQEPIAIYDMPGMLGHWMLHKEAEPAIKGINADDVDALAGADMTPGIDHHHSDLARREDEGGAITSD